MSGKAQWFTPTAAMKNKAEVWTKLENSGWKPPKHDTSKPMTYFNNTTKVHERTPEYDLFFAYTKVFPLWDQKKLKDNCQNKRDIWENINEQEKNKPIPILSSFNYGLAARAHLEYFDPAFRRIHATGDFQRRHGVQPVEEKEPQ
ncbi:uncharacterized protein LOC135124506 [Zophobas morio]|uniref:uncharacterized protein LOC135124506 n=1 Tax=Zophobas morio TaxID=2755281 RepID=UPI003082B768